MSLTPQTITIDLNPSFSQMQTVHCSQYDDNIRQIEVKLKDGGVDADVSSYTIYIEGTKPDKHGFSYPLNDIGSVDGNTVTFYIQLQMAAVPGMTRMEILLKDGDDHRIGSANFMLAVERAGLQDDTNVSDSELAPYISGAAQQAAAAANSAEAAEQAKDDAIQAKDDAVQAKESAEQSAESISGLSEQIEQNTEDCRDLKSAVDYELPQITGWEANSYIVVTGDEAGSVGQSNYYQASNFVRIIPTFGNVNIIAGDTSWYGRGYNAWYDGNKQFISAFIYNGNTTTILTPPSNAAYMRLSKGNGIDVAISTNYDGKTVADWIELVYPLVTPTSQYYLSNYFSKKYIDISDRLGVLAGAQAFCMYNGKYYVIENSNNTIIVHNADFSTDHTISVSYGHGNAFQLGADGKGYISGWDDGKIYVFDFTTETITGSISLPYTGITTAVVDTDTNIAYIFQTDNLPELINPWNFIAYDLSTNTELYRKVTPAFAAIQGCDLLNGTIFTTSGLGTSAENHFRLYNTSGDVIGEYIIPSFASREPEGVFVDRTTYNIIIDIQSSVYKLTYR